ncbi:MAG: glycosyltransferase family 2 protein [Planctomycetia bacterium]|nr:glycosyltransferase family 2 protein [Planctomycetia bacterium]
MHADTVSVVIPVFNSAATLPELVRRLERVLAPRGAAFEIIPVNDGSRDRTWEVLRELAAGEPAVRGIDLGRNFGQHNALLCGIRAARMEVIVTLDDDLQNPPEEIPRLLEKLAEGHDVVYGVPRREQHGWWRDGASILTKRILRHVMGVATARHVSAFRAFRTRQRDSFAEYRGPFVSIDVLLSWGTNQFASVGVRHEPRRVGRSNYNLRKLMIHGLNLLTGFSTAPLHLASLVGLCAAVFGFVVLVAVVGRYLIEGSSVPGFPFLASIIALFAGIQMFTLGILGEYLARIYYRMLDRPSYTIRHQVREDG